MTTSFSRRAFFKSLPFAAAGMVLGHSHRAASGRSYRLETFYLAGYRHHEGSAYEHELSEGTLLYVEYEPENPHDNKAVRLSWRGAHMGYVPRRLNNTLANLLSEGAPLTGRIVKINRNEPPWHRIKVEIAIPTVERVAG